MTIIEIDQAVYDAAHRFFGVPNPGPDKLFIQDARGWVRNRSATLTESSTTTAPVTDGDLASTELYDIVVHDCFSGGGVPSHLYTWEFWKDLKTLVRPDGVVVVVSAQVALFGDTTNLTYRPAELRWHSGVGLGESRREHPASILPAMPRVL